MNDRSATLTREDALVYLRRFPAQGAVAAAINISLVLASNSVVLWLLVSGRLRAAHLIALVMLETVLLIAVAWILQRLVPIADWLEKPKPWREKAPLIAFVLIWIGFAYALTLAILQGYGDFVALFSDRQAWVASGLHWSLLATTALALLHASGDLIHYRRAGGPFLSHVSHDAMARYLTLLLGGIPFAMPFFFFVIGGFKGVEYVLRRARVAPAQSLLAGVAMMIVAAASFVLVSLLISSGASGWAIGFVFAKLIAEIAIAAIPLVMAHVARNGP
jgi:hypothetical protein